MDDTANGTPRATAPRPFNPTIERLTRAELRGLQLRLLQRQLKRVYATNPFYRELYDAAGFDPESVRGLEDFRAAPFVTKADLIADQATAPPLGTRVGDGIRVLHYTSGTTGAGREIHALTGRDIAALGAPLAYAWRWAGLEPGDHLVTTIPWGLAMAGPTFLEACYQYGLVPLFVAASDAEQKLRTLGSTGAQALVAVPAYLHRLELLARELGIDPRRAFPKLRAIFTATETFTPQWAQRVERFWGAKVYEWYGATQAAGASMLCCEHGASIPTPGAEPRRGMLHNLDHRVLVEVLEPDSGRPVEPGEFGELVVSVLHRESFPCLRFRMGDRVRLMPEGACDCGRPFTLIESGSISRYDDMIKIKGQNVWPQSIDLIVLDHDAVAEYRGSVLMDPESGREVARMEVELVTGIGNDEARRLLDEFRTRIRSAVGVSVEIELVPSGSLPRFDFKARRWTDLRREGREVTMYTEAGEVS